MVSATTYAADACSAVPLVLPTLSSAELEGCVCDSKLGNLQARFVPPFRIVAACNLKWRSGKPINLATQQIKLHQLTDGDYPLGTIFVSGAATFHGVLRHNEMGAVFVRLNKSFLRDGSVPLFYQLNVDELPRNVLIPKQLGNASCLEGRASLIVKGLRIVMGESDEAGVWPLQHDFLKASLEKNCTK